MSVEKAKKEIERSILAITDFSESSTNAILFAARLFKDVHLNLKLLHVFENPDEEGSMLISIGDILYKKSEEGLQKQSREIGSILKDDNIPISTHSATDILKKAIASIIQSEDVDLIVAGIPSGKYPFKNSKNTPLLFIGQTKFPVLLVPENCQPEPIKNVLALNLSPHLQKDTIDKRFEHIVNHDHVSMRMVSLNEKKIGEVTIDLLQTTVKNEKTDLIILAPAPGDKIEMRLLDYQVDELCTAFAKLLNC